MPRKQISLEEQDKIKAYVEQQFPGYSEKKIYSVLYSQKGNQFWEGVERAIGVKSTHARQFYMDSYTRAAFRDVFRLNIYQIDLKIIEFLRTELEKFNELESRSKPQFLRKFIIGQFHNPDEQGQYKYHLEQVYDHVLGFFKINGQFVSTQQELDLLQERAEPSASNIARTQMPGVVYPVASTAKQKKETAETRTTQAEDSSSYLTGSEDRADPPQLARVQNAVHSEEDLYDEQAYHDMINQMTVPQVLNHIRIFSDVYKALVTEGDRLTEKVAAYRGAAQNFIKDVAKIGE